MKIPYKTLLNGNAKSIVIEHNGEELAWIIKSYKKFNPDEFSYGDVNEILASMTDTEQDNLFAIYKQIHTDMLEIYNPTRLEEAVVNNLRKIEEIVPYERVVKHLQAKNSIWVPIDEKEFEFEQPAFQDYIRNTDPDAELPEPPRAVTLLTYTKYDYKQAIALIVHLKFFMPVLSHFYSLDDSTVEFFKCSKTMDLLATLNIVQTDGWKRLNSFIHHHWIGPGETKLSPGVLLEGLSESLVVDWIRSELLFRKWLPIGVLHRYQAELGLTQPNFLSGLFNHISGYSKTLTEGTMKTHYMDKNSGRTAQFEEDMSSTLENYKIAGEFSDKEIVINNVFLHDIDNILKHVDSTLPREYLDDILYDPNYHKPHNEVRKRVMQWILGKVISPKMVVYVDSKAYENCFLVVSALLRHWGFDDILKIVDSQIDYDTLPETLFSTMDVTIEQVRELQQYYPHEVTSNKVKGDSRRDSSYVITALNILENNVRGRHMRSFNPAEHWVCMSNVKYRLAELIIYMNRNQFI